MTGEPSPGQAGEFADRLVKRDQDRLGERSRGNATGPMQRARLAGLI
ncbi:hypothetical protein [Lichenicoccus sp.]